MGSKVSSLLSCVSRSQEHDGPSVSMAELQQNRPQQQLKRHENDNILRLLSWNIEGLGTELTIERAMAVCDEIESRQPDVVYLQEIVPQTWEAITTRLKSVYLFYRDEATQSLYPVRYYHILMIRVGSAAIAQSELEVLKFPGSTQDRSLLQLAICFYNHDIQLFTSHLESLVQNTAERKKQLRTVFGLMSEASKSFSQTCIFGGDLNLMDKELNQVGLPDDFADVWEACGADSAHKYTWDTTEPRFRLDRIYVTPKDSSLHPIKFELIGASKVTELKTYPSDHLGLWCEFVLNGKMVVSENDGHSETNNTESVLEEGEVDSTTVVTADGSNHGNDEGSDGSHGNDEGTGNHGDDKEVDNSNHGDGEESDEEVIEEAGLGIFCEDGIASDQTDNVLS